MGLQHFKLSMLPRAYFTRTGLPVPVVLSEEEIDYGEGDPNGWWSSLQPSEPALARLRKLCPQDKSWGETEEFVTDETWGSDLRIWWEQGRVCMVKFRFSPGTDARRLLDDFVAIARDENCLLLDERAGILLEPDDKIVAERLDGSLAMRFVQDPQGALIQAARETPQ